jgi:hypothetical protein
MCALMLQQAYEGDDATAVSGPMTPTVVVLYNSAAACSTESRSYIDDLAECMTDCT